MLKQYWVEFNYTNKKGVTINSVFGGKTKVEACALIPSLINEVEEHADEAFDEEFSIIITRYREEEE